MIDAKTLGPFEQVYTFVADDGTNTHIHAERLRLYCQKVRPEVFACPVDKAFAATFIRDNLASVERVKEIILGTNGTELEPIIFCHRGTFTDGKPDVMLVDGHHRYLMAALLDVPKIPCYSLRKSFWLRFKIKGMPDIDKAGLSAMPHMKRSY